MSVLAAIDLASASLAATAAIYQIWLFRRRPERREYLFSAIIAIAAAIYAGCMVANYQSTSAAISTALVSAIYLAVLALTNSVPCLAEALTGKPIPRWSEFNRLSLLFWGVIIAGTQWVIPSKLDPIELSLHDGLYPQPAVAPLTGLFLVYCVAVSAFGTWWLIRGSRKGAGHNRFFMIGVGAWVVAGAHDSLVAIRAFDAPVMFLMEHGFLVFAVALFARTVKEHAELIDTQASALKASELNFRQLIEQLPYIVAVQRDTAIVYINALGAKALGYGSAAEVEGMSALDFVHPKDREQVADRVAELAVEAGATVARRETLIRKNRSGFTAEVVALPINFDNEPAHLVTARDLTEQVGLEAQLLQMDRMVAIGTLAAGVAHEINNPLTFVLGNFSIMSSNVRRIKEAIDCSNLPQAASQGITPHLEDLDECIKEAQHGAVRIKDIVGDLSDLSRQPKQTLEDVAIGPILESATKLAGHEIRHRALLVCEIGACPGILANAAKLSQVFLNLLINAAHSIPVGNAAGNTITLRSRTEGPWVIVEVTDTGSGMSKALVDTIFEPFVTTKPIGQGTGLGLAICRQVVVGYGGKIEVETEEGCGSTFRVLLPAGPSHRPELQSSSEVLLEGPAAANVPNSDQQGRVLIIDDEPAITRYLSRLLSERHHVQCAVGAEAALRLISDGQKFDVILCDLMMPDISGVEFLRTLETRHTELAKTVRFMTGGAFSEDILEFVGKLEEPPMRKPFDDQAMKDMVAKKIGCCPP